MKPFMPCVRADAIEASPVADELLVYDGKTDQAHSLNPAAAAVFRRCDGKTSVGDLAREVAAELHHEPDLALVNLALEQLSEAGLLEQPFVSPARQSRLSRRAFARGLGTAAIVLPAVLTVLAPTPAQACSIPMGGDCSGGGTCCGGTSCVGGICM